MTDTTDNDEFDPEEYKAEIWVHLKAEGCTCDPDIRLIEGEVVVQHQVGCQWAGS